MQIIIKVYILLRSEIFINSYIFIRENFLYNSTQQCNSILCIAQKLPRILRIMILKCATRLSHKVQKWVGVSKATDDRQDKNLVLESCEQSGWLSEWSFVRARLLENYDATTPSVTTWSFIKCHPRSASRDAGGTSCISVVLWG